MNSRGSNAVIGPAAERPLVTRSQLVATSLANGVTAPSPVTTTLRRPLAPINPSDPQSAVDEEHLARDDHEATARRFGNRQVFLAGWRPHEDLPQALNAADALVLPSVAEAFGPVLVEAMACGLPVIACRTPGPAAIVADGGTGWLIPPHDEDALVDALVSAASDQEERRARGRRAQTESRRYGWAEIAPRFASLYEELLASSPGQQVAQGRRA
jgi:glycosyltransferase involved in cell wall biosynthesis